jgi:hypothetical protein
MASDQDHDLQTSNSNNHELDWPYLHAFESRLHTSGRASAWQSSSAFVEAGTASQHRRGSTATTPILLLVGHAVVSFSQRSFCRSCELEEYFLTFCGR